MSNFFIELYSEEIPFKMTRTMVTEVKKSFKDMFLSLGLVKKIEDDNFCQVYITPCRIILYTDILENETTIDSKEIVGPKIEDEEEVSNFLKAFNISTVEELVKRDGYYVLTKEEIKLNTKDIIEKNINNVLNNISSSFLQNINWNCGNNYWVSPLRNIVCLFDNDIVNFEYCGIKSSNSTFGHKTLIGFDKKITIDSFDDYRAKMRENFVLFDPKERREVITTQIASIEKEFGLSTIKAYSINYEDIIEEIVYTTEFPSVYMGEFGNEYLKLPQLIIKDIVFKEYNSICLKNENNILSNKFILFANTKTDNNGKYIIKGVERSVNTRLSFISSELVKYLSENLDTKMNRLKSLTYAKDFGSILDHVNRIVGLAKFLCLWLPHCDLIMTEEAARLCKIEYTTNLIKIHPELRGFLASHYAKLNNYPEPVCNGLEEYYKPKDSCDDIPSTDIGKVLAISDRIDNITSLFIKNRESTSSNDPYGIRKNITAVIKIIIDSNMGIPLGVLIHKSISLFGTNVYKDNKDNKVSVKMRISEIQSRMMELFEKRFYSFIECRGYDIKIINAIKNAKDKNVAKAPYKLNSIYNKVVAISEYQAKEPEKFDDIRSIYKRLKNILSDFDDGDVNRLFENIFRTLSFKSVDEQVLNEKISNIKRELKSARKSENYTMYMDLLFEFDEILEDYFKDHLIRSDNVKETNRRLFLLLKVKKAFDIFLDFSVL